MNSVYIGGTFDVPHLGHANLISRIKRMGYYTIVVVNSDDFVSKYRKEPCVLDQNQRAAVMEAHVDVDEVHIVDKEEQMDLIDMLNPDFIAVDTSWLRPEIIPQLGITEDFMRANNISLMVLPRTPGISSTEIKKWSREKK